MGTSFPCLSGVFLSGRGQLSTSSFSSSSLGGGFSEEKIGCLLPLPVRSVPPLLTGRRGGSLLPPPHWCLPVRWVGIDALLSWLGREVVGADGHAGIPSHCGTPLLKPWQPAQALHPLGTYI